MKATTTAPTVWRAYNFDCPPSQRARLATLRDALIADANNPTGIKFDLGHWVGGDHERMSGKFLPEQLNLPTTGVTQEDVNELKIAIPMSCNTSACALGLAALLPEFNKMGLGFETVPIYECSYDPDTKSYLPEKQRTVVRYHMEPEYNGLEGFDAGAEFFGLSASEAMYLFDPSHYPYNKRAMAEGELYVAARIDALLRGEADVTYAPQVMFYEMEEPEDDEDAFDEDKPIED